MVDLRPHTLRYAVIGDGYQDPVNGDWVTGITTWSEPIKCRYQANSKALEIELPSGDGKVRKYAYEVFLDLDNTRDYLLGQHIKLFDDRGVMVAQKQVLGFDIGQLNMRIWV